jgi:hypothetical protein
VPTALNQEGGRLGIHLSLLGTAEVSLRHRSHGQPGTKTACLTRDCFAFFFDATVVLYIASNACGLVQKGIHCEKVLERNFLWQPNVTLRHRREAGGKGSVGQRC